MRIYWLTYDLNRHQTVLINGWRGQEWGLAEVDYLDAGSPVGKSWSQHELDADIDDLSLASADFLSCNWTSSPVVNARTRAFLEQRVPEIEYLPLPPELGERWIANVLRVADVLDERATDYRDSGTIFRYRFHEDRLDESKLGLFRLPQDIGTVFLSSGLWSEIQEAGLTGLKPIEKWPSL